MTSPISVAFTITPLEVLVFIAVWVVASTIGAFASTAFRLWRAEKGSAR